MSKKKMCEVCGVDPATVPDRDRPGRLINRVCSKCHGARLSGDMKYILQKRKERREKAESIGVGNEN